VLAAMLLPAGRAADSLGRSRCFMAGLAVFGSASLGCALAPSLLVLIACRGLQAMGAAVLIPTSLGLALSVFPARQRGTAVGVWASVGGVAAAVGPVLGGLLAERDWRWIFVINVPPPTPRPVQNSPQGQQRSPPHDRSAPHSAWRSW
jgi:MFS family permease